MKYLSASHPKLTVFIEVVDKKKAKFQRVKKSQIIQKVQNVQIFFLKVYKN